MNTKASDAPKEKTRKVRTRVSASAPKKASKKLICDAKLKGGRGRCMAKPMANGRCRSHGGRDSKGATTKSRLTEDQQKHADQLSIYADVGLLDTEYNIYPSIASCVGTLDQELTMMRVKLRRLYDSQRRLDAIQYELNRCSGDRDAWMALATESGVLSVHDLEREDGQVLVGTPDDRRLEDYVKRKLLRKIERFDGDIAKFTTAIARLEKDRRDLIEGSTGGPDFLRDLAMSLRDFAYGAKNTLPGCEEFGSGNYEVDE